MSVIKSSVWWRAQISAASLLTNTSWCIGYIWVAISILNVINGGHHMCWYASLDSWHKWKINPTNCNWRTCSHRSIWSRKIKQNIHFRYCSVLFNCVFKARFCKYSEREVYFILSWGYQLSITLYGTSVLLKSENYRSMSSVTLKCSKFMYVFGILLTFMECFRFQTFLYIIGKIFLPWNSCYQMYIPKSNNLQENGIPWKSHRVLWCGYVITSRPSMVYHLWQVM